MTEDEENDDSPIGLEAFTQMLGAMEEAEIPSSICVVSVLRAVLTYLNNSIDDHDQLARSIRKMKRDIDFLEIQSNQQYEM